MPDKTQALNAMLGGIGVRPVTNYDDPHLDAIEARATLERVNIDIQSKGWWFNDEDNWMLTPGEFGKIAVPNGALSIVSWGVNGRAELSIRGRYIYDAYTHGHNLNHLVDAKGKIHLRMIMGLDFDDLPVVAANAIMYRARRQFGLDSEGDTTKYAANTKDEDTALAILESTNLKALKLNAMQNPVAAAFRARVGGPNARPLGVYRLPSGGSLG